MKILIGLFSFIVTFVWSMFCAPLNAWRKAAYIFHLCICDHCRHEVLVEMKKRQALREREGQ